MVTSGCPPSDFEDEGNDDRIRPLVDFWNIVPVLDELDATKRKALEPLERLVTDCLFQVPPDIGRAESVTALALRIISGWSRD